MTTPIFGYPIRGAVRLEAFCVGLAGSCGVWLSVMPGGQSLAVWTEASGASVCGNSVCEKP